MSRGKAVPEERNAKEFSTRGYPLGYRRSAYYYLLQLLGISRKCQRARGAWQVNIATLVQRPLGNQTSNLEMDTCDSALMYGSVRFSTDATCDECLGSCVERPGNCMTKDEKSKGKRTCAGTGSGRAVPFLNNDIDS